MVVSNVTVEKIFNTTLAKLKDATTADAKKTPWRNSRAPTVQYKVTTEVKLYTPTTLGWRTEPKDELVVDLAHYDHIGKMKAAQATWSTMALTMTDPGNGSVLAIAKALQQAKKEGKGPRRSILFMTVTGEEKGLLGSEYYSEHLVFRWPAP